MIQGDPDLIVLFDEINKEYFNKEIELNMIDWASTPALHKLHGVRKHKDIIWAICVAEPNAILLAEVIKKAKYMPKYLLRYLIHHECLHYIWAYHCKSFLEQEASFPQSKKAEKWLEKHERLFLPGDFK